MGGGIVKRQGSAEPLLVNENSNVAKEPDKEFKSQIVWLNVIALLYVHIVWLYGLYLYLTKANWATVIIVFLIGSLTGISITAGAHRLWTHRSYKAKMPLQIFLLVLQTIAFQNSVYEWVRDHRVHHKYTETDADPHNPKRGFWFSHVGWLAVKKHPEVRNKGKNIDMSDLESDPLVMWQKKYYPILMPIFCFLLPTLFIKFVLGETWSLAYHINIGRFVMVLNSTWLINSAAHIWGSRPYDKKISATDTAILGITCFGEGWHNYHHVFPWDYKSSELLDYRFNVTNAFIDFFAWIGWAYDLRTVSQEMIRDRALRTGDWTKRRGTDPEMVQQAIIRYINQRHESEETTVWGWNDKDMKNSDKKLCTVFHKVN